MDFNTSKIKVWPLYYINTALVNISTALVNISTALLPQFIVLVMRAVYFLELDFAA